jgi:hypothetical protein
MAILRLKEQNFPLIFVFVGHVPIPKFHIFREFPLLDKKMPKLYGPVYMGFQHMIAEDFLLGTSNRARLSRR